jgi:acetyl/propionyl-CoA carboxylase alpha subunit
MALRDTGFDVEIVCPGGHLVARLKVVRRTHTFHALFPNTSIRAAILEAHPDLLIPCDDLATGHLHAIYAKTRSEGAAGSGIAGLLERSLGDPVGFPIAAARSRLMALAEAEDIRVPRTTLVQDLRQVDAWIAAHGLPAVLKTDGTSGGVGVKIVNSLEEAHRAFADLNVPPIAARVAKRAIIDRDVNLVPPFLLRQRPLINIQTFVRGYDATSAVACWQGKVLAAILFEVVHTWRPKGPASVLRVIENREMCATAARIAAKLKLSGLYGFDFMIEQETGDAFLIEMNPRATQTCHLPLGGGRNLPAALWAILSGEPIPDTKSITEKKEIALFPQEWQRNPASHFLSAAYHDVPWEEPELIRACIEDRPEGGIFSASVLAQAYDKMPWRR